VTGRGPSQYRELAKYYDPLNDWKDYRREARRLESIARRFGRPGRTAWLDVACGTGRHLELLRRTHPVVGVDGSADMLRIARKRLPGVRLVLADMRTFDLGRQFDVVSCLFSAIGHLDTKDDVQKAFANMAQHTRPGGVVIVEPWIPPSAFHAGSIHMRTHVDPSLTVARCAFSARRGIRSVIHYHYLVGEPGRGVRYFEVTDVGLLLSPKELLRLLRSAGLAPRFLAHGLMPGRGLLVGVKPVV
jgi:SAM-dependent methyltransferase